MKTIILITLTLIVIAFVGIIRAIRKLDDRSDQEFANDMFDEGIWTRGDVDSKKYSKKLDKLNNEPSK